MSGPGILALGLLVAAVASLATPYPNPLSAPHEFPGWPADFEGHALEPLPLSSREERLGAGLQGKIARFGDGERQIVLRWLDGPARGYHGATDCYRGKGFELAPLPPYRDANGRIWSSFSAARGGERLRVRERVESADGASAWAVPAEWYWEALLGRTRGPCWGWLVVEPWNAGSAAATDSGSSASLLQAARAP